VESGFGIFAWLELGFVSFYTMAFSTMRSLLTSFFAYIIPKLDRHFFSYPLQFTEAALS